MANQLLLPILGDTNPNDNELFVEEEFVEAKLKKGVSKNAKPSHWVGAFSKVSTTVRHAAVVMRAL